MVNLDRRVSMIRVTYGTCTRCHNTFPVGDWYMNLNVIEIQRDDPWICPGCKERLNTQEITISYEFEGGGC